MDQKKIGAFIADIRKSKGYTQKEIAEMLGISEKTVSKWECGNGLPEVVFMEPLCNILGITVNEMLLGEFLDITSLINKMDTTRIDLMKQLEYEQLKMRIFKLYGMEIESIQISDKGAGSVTYIVNSSGKKYVVKYASDNEMNHPDIEPELCRYLNEKGIPVCEFVNNKLGTVISTDENGRRFHIQKFIEGNTYSYNEAPESLLTESAVYLSKIHSVLKDYGELPEGIGADFFKYRTPEATINSYENTLSIAIANCDYDIAGKIKDNIEILKSFPHFKFDVSELSCGNTHGDYIISQLICSDNEIRGIIDWTTACRHPYIWEIVRSYVYMASECRNGEINIDKFENYLRTYLKGNKLNKYDIDNAGNLFYFFLAVCDFYGQYYHSLARNRNIYLEQANLSGKLLKWFNQHNDELTKRLKAISAEVV